MRFTYKWIELEEKIMMNEVTQTQNDKHHISLITGQLSLDLQIYLLSFEYPEM